MADDILPFSSAFPEATEADWLREVEKALKGKGAETLTRKTADGVGIKALYRESDFAGASDPLGVPGAAPFLRGKTAAPDKWLPWDIRQSFAHPSPAQTNAEILRDLERGVSSIELHIDGTGANGVQLCSADDFKTALAGVDAAIAPVALESGRGMGARTAGLLGQWADGEGNAAQLKLDFNMNPLGALAKTGRIEGGLDAAFAKTGALAAALTARFPAANLLRMDATLVHEAGGSEAQELGALIASAIDTLRRLDGALDAKTAAGRMVFAVALDANYGVGIAKLRAARRLWARCLEALGLETAPMRLQAITSARMLTKYDPWTNMLRGTAAAFAGAVGGADILTVRAFNEALGLPEELGRRIARNTQVIAMEESQLGRVADATGGAWFTETLAEDLAKAAWEEFQKIESEGGYAASLMAGAFQARVATVRETRAKDIARRKIPLTGISEYPLLEEIGAPVADVAAPRAKSVSDAGLKHFVKALPAGGADVVAAALEPVRLAAPFEALRDAAARATRPPAVFLATLGSLAEFTARADFARNFFAAGGIVSKEPPVPPKTAGELAAAFKASGCRIAVLCSTDKMYETEAAGAAEALKKAGAQRVWLAGKHEGAGIDANIFAGADVVHLLKLAQAELGVAQ
ncbi:MAG: methylmalonyl-CoA mutase [Hyphomonas sp.]|uniref:methylmalonyl-CoA mutase family protein n=1 Tax=Hyphomonas sp. TaxID=87 RepID=UPI0017982B03|nr:methylmalonyl-CoA mutase family protein [Hyphomonas sp.]MBU3921702.1 methylmalonyl-CoA mutase [Alphaproteobacteria bacterium]MBA3068144.1 methylmalonyl-CoA mutase [Hyphomonas sp.]MBU4061121.1 methylmalonyl-CoA mutase [Alphaproteobacteria bacterium]MBU4162845.1 methylmalonyl-CoA mutase [Alphaproteobacteria bacterium]MBU4568163.1 methylmalonyl-CoA mutase [Alphaproteobacteria bacterium]